MRRLHAGRFTGSGPRIQAHARVAVAHLAGRAGGRATERQVVASVPGGAELPGTAGRHATAADGVTAAVVADRACAAAARAMLHELAALVVVLAAVLAVG